MRQLNCTGEVLKAMETMMVMEGMSAIVTVDIRVRTVVEMVMVTVMITVETMMVDI